MSTELKPKVGYIAKICLISPSSEWKDKYKGAIEIHNQNLEASVHPDSGFDIFTPEPTVTALNSALRISFFNSLAKKFTVQTVKSDMKIKIAMYKVIYSEVEGVERAEKQIPTGYYMDARSSISKTDLRLANNVGIIDSGYRGNLIGMFDVLPREAESANDPIRLESGHRLLQICAPSLEPFWIEYVAEESDLGTTVRGSGGFGSTGCT